MHADSMELCEYMSYFSWKAKIETAHVTFEL